MRKLSNYLLQVLSAYYVLTYDCNQITRLILEWWVLSIERV